jgi:FKBP-type peptidyl-prolyl cis-trans isomerase SlyD
MVRIFLRDFLEEGRMKIEPNKFVSIEYTLSLDSGKVVDRSDPGKPLGFIFNAGQMISGLEKGLDGMESGQSCHIDVEPEDGYGYPLSDLMREVPRSNFPSDMEIEPGMVFKAATPTGMVHVTVKSIQEDVVLVDMNHPLAGERLHFDVKVNEVREPTEDELAEVSCSASCDGADSEDCGGGCGCGSC